ncbi:MAG TPA: peptidylprolyl isomerase [Deltaproteobacteria bacterium]|nr:peptidylprolyl isomerase [Deltaproteobacteria bacterium]HQB39668.1 peptidylprolyl isomerase [Deltaproteobacteria bacterium]
MKLITTSKILAFAICTSALLACQNTPGSSAGGSKVESKPLAEVNGKTLTTADLTRELKNLPDYLKAVAESPQGRKDMLDNMIIRELVLQQAAKDGVDKSPEIDEKLQDIKKRLIMEAFLKKKVEKDAMLSDADLKKFYDQNIDKFKAPEQVKASHILVKNEKEANDILTQIKGGASFEELAKKHSVDATAAKGGDLGWFGKGSMVPVFEKAAMALKQGQVSGVVKSDFGFHIIKQTGKRAAGTRPFDEVKDQIKSALLPSKQQEVFLKLKEDLKKNAKISIKEDVLNSYGAKKNEPKKDEAKKQEPKQGAAKPEEKKPADAPKTAPADKK